MMREKWLQRLASFSTKDLVKIVKDYDQCYGCSHDENSALPRLPQDRFRGGAGDDREAKTRVIRIVRLIARGFTGQAPVYLVECPDCGDTYQTSSWPMQLAKVERCHSCHRARVSHIRTYASAGGRATAAKRRGESPLRAGR